MGEYAEYGFDQQGWCGMFVACGIWCLVDVSSVSPSSEWDHKTDINLFMKDIVLGYKAYGKIIGDMVIL